MRLADKYGDLDVFWAVDHSQLEIRVLAQMSKDRRLISLIQSGEDIHSAVGHELTGKPIEQIKKDRDTRTMVKGFHFGIIYGLQPKSLFFKLQTEAKQRGEAFNTTEEQVFGLYNKYFERFSGVKEWLDSQVEFAQDNGYVTTLFGFKREISQVPDGERETFWRNQAVNTPIQGTAHQLMLIALAVFELKKKTYAMLKRLSMEIHDSTVGFTKLRDIVETYNMAIQLLEKDVFIYLKKWWPELDWQVPLKAEGKFGFRLGVLIPYAGEQPEEFLEKWCEANAKFEESLKKDMQKAKVETV